MAQEQVGYAGNEGTIVRGAHRALISGVGATRQLLQKESGSMCLFDRAAGVVYTLPTPVVGMQFEFFTTVAITTNSAKVITKTIASEFIVGELGIQTIATVTPAGFAANGTTIVSVNGNGTTTGGLQGDRFMVTAVSTTLWTVHGMLIGSGVLVTPFATT